MIIDDTLVMKVTAEIIRRLGEAGARPGAAEAGPVAAPAAGPGTAPAAGPLLLAGPASLLSKGCLDALCQSYELTECRGLDVSALPKAPLLITSLGLQALVQVASGDEGCTTEGRLLLPALLEGRPALALKSGVTWRNLPPSAPRGLLSIYRAAEMTLRGSGLRIVTEPEILAALRAGPPRRDPPAAAGPGAPAGTSGGGGRGTAAVPGGGRRVLSEATVASLFPEEGGGELELGPGDILTPLAKDYLSAKRIPIRRAPK